MHKTRNYHIFLTKLDFFYPYILSIAIILYLLKTAFWPLTYLFAVNYFILILIFLIKFNWKFRINSFLQDYFPPLLLALFIFGISIFHYQFANTIVQKDLLRIVILFSIFFFHYRDNFNFNSKIPYVFSYKVFIFLLAFISIVNMLVKLSIIPFSESQLLKMNISNGLTIAYDYNFYCLFFLFGLVLINYRNSLGVFKYKFSRLTIAILNLLFITSIVLSGSFRAMSILAILLIVFLIIKLYYFFKKYDLKNKIRVFVFFMMFGLSFIFLSSIVLHSIPKTKLFELSGKLSPFSKFIDIDRLVELILYKPDVSNSTKNAILINGKTFGEESDIYTFFQADGTFIYDVETPFGKGKRILRSNAFPSGISFAYDGPKIIYYANHTYEISFKVKILKGKFDSFNVGWWVDDGQKGPIATYNLFKRTEFIKDDWYAITSTYTFVDNHVEASGFLNSFRDSTDLIIADFELKDLDYNPALPKYYFEVRALNDPINWINDKNPPIFNETNLIVNGDFKDGLKFWEFSKKNNLVTFEKTDTINYAKITCFGLNNPGCSLIYKGRNFKFDKSFKYHVSFKIKITSRQPIFLKIGFWNRESEGYIYSKNLIPEFEFVKEDWRHIYETFETSEINKQKDHPATSKMDTCEFLITNIVVGSSKLQNISNCTYNEIIDDNGKNRFSESLSVIFKGRTDRWRYGYSLWKTEYRWYNKLFGHGYDYLDWYGQKFNNNLPDWPHNPFITVLLYSGIIGLLFYIWLLFKVVKLYLISSQLCGIAFICFLMTFFFSFFSGSSPFDPPIMGFFMILPFFIHSVHKHSRTKTIENPDYAKYTDNRDK